jgi:hypothetical protein
MHPLLPLVLIPVVAGLCIGLIVGDRRTRRRRKAVDEAAAFAAALRLAGSARAQAELGAIVDRYERADLDLVDATPRLLTFARPSAFRSFTFERLVYFPLEPFYTVGCWLGGEREERVDVAF